PTNAAEDPRQTDVPAASQAPANASPPPDPLPAPSPRPVPHAETRARLPEKAASPWHGSDKPTEKPLSALRAAHPIRRRTLPTLSAQRDSERKPDIASDAGALA